jgi:hypothetical protein
MENLALLSNEELLEIISQAKAIIESRKSDKQFVVKTFESIDPRKNGHAYMARLSFADGKVGREFIDYNGKTGIASISIMILLLLSEQKRGINLRLDLTTEAGKATQRFGIWSLKTRAASWYYSDLSRYKSQRYADKRA